MLNYRVCKQGYNPLNLKKTDVIEHFIAKDKRKARIYHQREYTGTKTVLVGDDDQVIHARYDG